MLRTSLYCLLSIVASFEFSDELQQVEDVKNGLIKYLRKDAYQLLEQIDMMKHGKGWRHVLVDFTIKNELNPVMYFNFPDITKVNIDC